MPGPRTSVQPPGLSSPPDAARVTVVFETAALPVAFNSKPVGSSTTIGVVMEHVTPKLTTVAQDTTGKAITAVRLLPASVETGRAPTEPVTTGVRLVERASTAPPPAGRRT
ncbi:substrate-binding domain-containing protein [Saccharothrix sp. HUAS TT1]|uniref:substrate-binding domain-containing protein n=1 Tax=unclassified Saccharothrix TaxID=2593673 RepID=UPI00345B67E7